MEAKSRGCSSVTSNGVANAKKIFKLFGNECGQCFFCLARLSDYLMERGAKETSISVYGPNRGPLQVVDVEADQGQGGGVVQGRGGGGGRPACFKTGNRTARLAAM